MFLQLRQQVSELLKEFDIGGLVGADALPAPLTRPGVEGGPLVVLSVNSC